MRFQVMGGSFMRPPTPVELEKMCALVEQAMQEGAVGLSTGLIYLPGSFAKTDEIVALAIIARPMYPSNGQIGDVIGCDLGCGTEVTASLSSPG